LTLREQAARAAKQKVANIVIAYTRQTEVLTEAY